MPTLQRKILIVDDEQNMRIALYEALSRRRYQVQVAENGTTALAMMEKSLPDLVIADIKMPEMDGITLLREIRGRWPEMLVVIITGYATVETAVAAMRQGAFDYILKPFPVEVIEKSVERAFDSLAKRNILPKAVKEKGRGLDAPRPIIGKDPKLLALLQRARTVASSKATVLILGESGTGKEVFARYIHHASNRRQGPFVALNCAALPETLLESELFGHEKGAFTGAVAAKKGKFELADSGTLLLDEIGEIPLHLQAKLLRVLQEEEVDRLGGRHPVKVDVHVIATTNRDLEEAVRQGEFRQDLFYRLNVIPLKLPPLRERKDDIPLLADHFVKKFSSRYNRPTKKLSAASLKRFLEYDWPGNVREMENMVERAVLLSGTSELEPWDFWDEPPPARGAGVPSPPLAGDEEPAAASSSMNLKEVERQLILKALEQTGNNRTHAARILGISVRTLRNKLNEYRTQGIITD